MKQGVIVDSLAEPEYVKMDTSMAQLSELTAKIKQKKKPDR